ncbi:hypothetical protein GPUN_2105 [Glaciecola punicea ACAM 611]|uniref:Uncharacterized protein n=1 Tax=Glaciecola punicea ACAM 611 TaxID=1121923 RepID=H5TD43_9ALTE|nr:hypothetical protein GPUN_2105 [Glaciecola punicea ACAM 611]
MLRYLRKCIIKIVSEWAGIFIQNVRNPGIKTLSAAINIKVDALLVS